MTRILLVRHGATEWSATGRHTSRTDLALTADGRAEATALSHGLRSYLGGSAPALVLTSPMRRARETATLAGFGDVAVVDPDLAEMDYGDYEGRTTDEIRGSRPGWTVWDGCSAGETPEQVGTRADRVLQRVVEVDGLVVIFGHGHCLRVLVARWLGLPPIEGCRFALDTATLSVLGYERELPILERLNVAVR